ncbi:MAG: hypothetical protein ACWA49_07570 [Ruegeria sp.]
MKIKIKAATLLATALVAAGCEKDTVGMNYLETARADSTTAAVSRGDIQLATFVNSNPCLYTESRETTGADNITNQINGQLGPGFAMSFSLSGARNNVTSNDPGCPTIEGYTINIWSNSPNFGLLRYTSDGRAQFEVDGVSYDTDLPNTYFRARITSFGSSSGPVSGEFEAIARAQGSNPERMIAVVGSFNVAN